MKGVRELKEGLNISHGVGSKMKLGLVKYLSRVGRSDCHLNNKPTTTDPSSHSSSNYVSSGYRRRHRPCLSYLGNFNVGLEKSKSVASVPRNKLSKKDGFWCKLLKLTKKNSIPRS
ncbi:unnamed protein product [Lupinus luteus]|uniref:Uncharacterized protein n=1 Tax=Lupinus luteus TaxID=3873 RepID=A0AAV1XTG2_LUPLU